MAKRKNKPITEYLAWVEALAFAPESYRQEVKKQVLESLKQFSDLGEGNADKTVGLDLYKEFSNEKKWEFIGFTPNVQYLKIRDADKASKNALWIHPWGTETLLFKHKKLPMVVSINPGIRFNSSYLDEMATNRKIAPKIQGLSS